AILLQGVSPSEAVSAAQRVTMVLSANYALDQHGDASVGVSIGVACAPLHASGSEALLSFADKALYAAKSAGLGIPRLFDHDLNLEPNASFPLSPSGISRRDASSMQALREAAKLANDLRLALRAGHLHLNYQP